MIYKPLPDYPIETLIELAHQVMASEPPYSVGDIDNIIEIMRLCTWEEVDFILAEALCEKFMKSSDETLKRIAIESTGDITRVYRHQVRSNIMDEIYRIYDDPKHPHWGTADDTWDAIEKFLKIPRFRLPDYTLETLIERAQQVINSESPHSQEDLKDIRGIVLSFAMKEIDFTLAEALCEKFIKSSDETLKKISIECVGHIARVYRRQVNSTIMEELSTIYKEDPINQYWGTADAAWDEIEEFLKIDRPELPD